LHGERGCSDSIYNGHLIGSWLYIPTNTTYIGMLQFDNVEEFIKEFKNIEILEWICPNKQMICANAFYPKDTHPQCYGECKLK
jgi:hypothetical protein